MFGLQPSHVSRDARQFPERDFKMPKDFARTETAQHLDVLLRDTAEAEFVGDAIYVTEEPRKAIGERAVEIENDKRVGHDLKRARERAMARSIAPNEYKHKRRNTPRYSALRTAPYTRATGFHECRRALFPLRAALRAEDIAKQRRKQWQQEIQEHQLGGLQPERSESLSMVVSVLRIIFHEPEPIEINRLTR
jgi:hypothetical protein